jgi:hypothetical protein
MQRCAFSSLVGVSWARGKPTTHPPGSGAQIGSRTTSHWPVRSGLLWTGGDLVRSACRTRSRFPLRMSAPTVVTVSTEAVAGDGEQVGPLDDEQLEELGDMADEIAEVRARLAQVPAATVVANHAMGLYELAAIHLMRQPPSFDESSLAIDALGALVDALPGRLGEAEETLRDALAQIRMTFVQVKAAL